MAGKTPQEPCQIRLLKTCSLWAISKKKTMTYNIHIKRCRGLCFHGRFMVNVPCFPQMYSIWMNMTSMICDVHHFVPTVPLPPYLWNSKAGVGRLNLQNLRPWSTTMTDGNADARNDHSGRFPPRHDGMLPPKGNASRKKNIKTCSCMVETNFFKPWYSDDI